MATRKKEQHKEKDKTPVAVRGDVQIPDTQEAAEQFLGQVPTAQPPAGFPIVGIGASAGGLAAFEAFFSGMPTDVDPGMAFILVQHLAPEKRVSLPIWCGGTPACRSSRLRTA